MAGSGVVGIKTKAEKTSYHYVINRQKMRISSGGHVNWYFVFARTNPDSKNLLHKGLTGFTITRPVAKECRWDSVTFNIFIL